MGCRLDGGVEAELIADRNRAAGAEGPGVAAEDHGGPLPGPPCLAAGSDLIHAEHHQLAAVADRAWLLRHGARHGHRHPTLRQRQAWEERSEEHTSELQ